MTKLKAIIASIGIACMPFISGCTFYTDQQKKQVVQDIEKRNTEIVSKFNNARLLKGKVINSSYYPGNPFAGGREGHTTLIVEGSTRRDHFRFDYDERYWAFGSPEKSDRAVKEIYLYNPIGTKIRWKDGFRPFDRVETNYYWLTGDTRIMELISLAGWDPRERRRITNQQRDIHEY